MTLLKNPELRVMGADLGRPRTAGRQRQAGEGQLCCPTHTYTKDVLSDSGHRTANSELPSFEVLQVYLGMMVEWRMRRTIWTWPYFQKGS